MKLDYHGDSGIVQPRGNVRIQTQTPAQGILSAIAMFRQLPNHLVLTFENLHTKNRSYCGDVSRRKCDLRPTQLLPSAHPSLQDNLNQTATASFGIDFLGASRVCCLLWVTCTVPVLP
jgi:hypothetical protein